MRCEMLLVYSNSTREVRLDLVRSAQYAQLSTLSSERSAQYAQLSLVRTQ